jgi:PQQ-dependent catabolism-associated CXXCW motif protein
MRWMLALGLIAAPAMAQAPLFDPAGYRASSYRAPVDRDPAPAQRIALAAARGLTVGRDGLFVDVLPFAPDHQSIPGALWLPDTGRSEVPPAAWAKLTQAVARFRAHHPGAPIILFCRADCWMSWNAARHLARDGVGGVFWLAEGIEGWREAGGALVSAAPR